MELYPKSKILQNPLAHLQASKFSFEVIRGAMKIFAYLEENEARPYFHLWAAAVSLGREAKSTADRLLNPVELAFALSS